jgi:hypothetical protein
MSLKKPVFSAGHSAFLFARVRQCHGWQRCDALRRTHSNRVGSDRQVNIKMNRVENMQIRAMSLQPVCGGPGCAKPATSEMIDADSKQFIAHVCSQACGVALIGMPKRAADDDDDARKRLAVQREDPRKLLKKKIRYSRALTTCYDIYSTLNKTIDADGRGSRWVAEQTLIDAMAKTLTIGSQMASAQTAQQRLDDLIVKLIAALGNMQAGLPHDDVDIDGALKKIRDGLAGELSLETFDAITGGFLRNAVVDDVRRLMAKRTNVIQVLARRGTFSELSFNSDTVEFLQTGPANLQYILFRKPGNLRIFDQSFAPNDQVQYESTNMPYRQSSHGILGQSDQYSYRSNSLINSWIITRPKTISYYGNSVELSTVSRTVLDQTITWKVGKQLMCGFRNDGATARVVVFTVRDDRIDESSFDIRGAVSDAAIDSDGFIWTVNGAKNRVTVYTLTGADIGSLPIPSNDSVTLYWADREGVWILFGRRTSDVAGNRQYILNEALRARVAP